MAGSPDAWWLRSSRVNTSAHVGRVDIYGGVSFGSASGNRKVRPAFNLNLNSVLFTSAADNSGHISFGTAIPDYGGSEWKATLKDGNNFSSGASVSGITSLKAGYSDTTLTISHATLSSLSDDYTHVTAALTDASGSLLYYGSVNSDTSATESTVTIPAGLTEGTYTLSIYGEDWNGANGTDYATGTPYTVTLTVDNTPPQPTTYTVEVQTEGDGTASASPTSATAGTTINLIATANSGYHFKEWQVISGGVTISGDSFTMPDENVTVKAVFEQDSTPLQYTVTFYTDYGTAPASMTVTEGTTITLPKLEDEGDHVFVGWWGIDTSGSSLYYSGEKYTVTGDVTFIADWDEIVTLTAPFTTTVELGDSGVPGETVFTLEIMFMGEVDEDMYQDMTISASVTTNGKGDYDGAMTFTGLSQQLKSMLRQGMFVQQVDDGKENWTYDDAVWYLVLADDTEVAAMALSDGVEPEYEPEYKILIFQATCEETENGPIYYIDWENLDWDSPEEKMLFTNTYTAHDYTQKYNKTEHWNECDCGDVQNKEAHQYGEWTVTKEATKTESGEKEHTCTVCGYVETVEIEKLPAAEPNPDTGTSTDNTDTNAQSPQTGDNSNIVLWFSLMLVAGAALAGTAVYARKKKRSR